MNKRHRIFLSLAIPNDVKKQLALYKEKWHELPAKWTSLDNLHITLEFLGNLTDQELGEVCMIVKEVAQRHGGFSITLNKVSYGPDNKIPPKYIFAKAEGSDDFFDLKQDMQEYLLERISFRPETKKSLIHVTLARILELEWRRIEPDERPNVGEEIDLTFSIESIEVMESVLKKTGPEYVVLESHNLKD